MFKISKEIRFLIHKALREDIGKGDVTTEVLIPRNLSGEAHIEVKQNGILSGGPVVLEVFRQIDSKLVLKQKVQDGKKVRKGQTVLLVSGRIQSILKAERVALNFLGRLSGIATLTHEFAERIRGTHARIFDTRKTTPLWRELEKYAVRCGGGQNHRFGLWDEVLVKDNHWYAVRKLLQKTHCRYFGDRLKSKLGKSKIPIEVEIASLMELSHLLSGNFVPDRILIDNFSAGNLRKAVQMTKRIRPKILLEASGGITLSNVREVAKTGVGRVSIGALTHSAPALDISLTVDRIGR